MQLPSQAAFESASRGGEVISQLGTALIVGAALIFVAVMALVVYGAVAGPQRIDGRRWIIGGGLIFPTIVLVAIFVYGLEAGSALSHSEQTKAMRVQVIGKLWWWEVRYLSASGTGSTVLANELRLPADCEVDLSLTSDNVIHSFWVPALAGKVDMIPGHANRLLLQPTKPGVYRGQCAEYCGDQHARMAFEVVVQSPKRFHEWLVRESAPAIAPTNEFLARGLDAFFSGGCATCHTIRGTAAKGRLGPDLTHVGSRRTLAAGTLSNHAGTMAGWIVGAQAIKPGSRMPSMNVYAGDELRAVAAYLRSLK
jgi:cytochrome c oxidase subunit II